MKKTIFLILFIISAVHCYVDATDQNHFPLFLPKSPTLNPQVPDENNGIPPAPIRIYSAEEQRQIRLNLVGQYEGTSNTGQIARLDIRNDGYIDINIGGIETTSHYLVNFFAPSLPLIFQRDEITHYYPIQIQTGSTEVTGLRAAENTYSISFFHKIPNMENNVIPRDDL